MREVGRQRTTHVEQQQEDEGEHEHGPDGDLEQHGERGRVRNETRTQPLAG
jgi:hypothetical protein